MSQPAVEERLSTGVAGLDEIMGGGFLSHSTYLVRGGPGVGKTTLGLHFLAAGVARGERVLLITLGESAAQIQKNGARMGLDLQGVEFLDLSPSAGFFAAVESYDIFSPVEVERGPITRRIVEVVSALRPSRVFIDSMTQFRYLATDAFQYRKQVLSFLRFLGEQGRPSSLLRKGAPKRRMRISSLSPMELSTWN